MAGIFGLASACPRLILASGSPRRVELLREAGFEPTVAPQDVDETPLAGESPQALVERLSRLKASSALTAAPAGSVIVAADTIVATAGQALGKPADAQAAREMLGALSGSTHQVSTGVCLVRVGAAGSQPRYRSFVETTDVTFYELSDADIDAYIATGEPMDKAGAYGIQGQGRALIRAISGDYFNVVGLPVARLLRELASILEEA